MSESETGRPWLLDLATPQRGRELDGTGRHYSDLEQITFLEEPNLPAIDVAGGPQTKKADIERGEDQKYT